MIGYKQLKLNEESLESGLTLLEAVYQPPEPGSQRSCDPEPGPFRETAAGVHPGNETDTDIQ